MIYPAAIATTAVTIPAEVSVSGMTIPAAPSMEIRIEAEPYEGPYECTPGDEEQTIPAAGKLMLRDFRINPIPANYGKVSWDGHILTIS